MLYRGLLTLSLLLLLASPAWAVFASAGKQTGTADASASSLALTAENVATGSLLVACFKHETAGVTISSITDTASNTWVLLTSQARVATNTPIGQCGYVLSATAHAANIVTANFSAGTTWRRGAVMEFTYSGVASFDAEVGSSDATTTLTPTSLSLSTAGTDEVCIAAQMDSNTQTFSGETINGSAFDQKSTLGDFELWSRIFTATFTGGTSSMTRTVQPSAWVQRLQCFKTNLSTRRGASAIVFQ